MTQLTTPSATTSPGAIFGRQPAFWIGLIVTIILGVIRTLAGEGLISEAAQGSITNAVEAAKELLLLLAPLLTGMLIKPTVTPTNAPVLKEGTSVTVQGSEDTVIVAKTPPGPIGVDGSTGEVAAPDGDEIPPG